MKEYFNLSLKKIWLLISVFSLILPIFMPSSANPQNFLANVIGTVTVTLFILAFPSSLFGLPVLSFVGVALELNPNSIESLYLNLFLLFVLGFVQWFWIVPRLLINEPRFQMLNIPGGKSEIQFSEAVVPNNPQSWDSQGKTRLEKVFKEKDSE